MTAFPGARAPRPQHPAPSPCTAWLPALPCSNPPICSLPTECGTGRHPFPHSPLDQHGAVSFIFSVNRAVGRMLRSSAGPGAQLSGQPTPSVATAPSLAPRHRPPLPAAPETAGGEGRSQDWAGSKCANTPRGGRQPSPYLPAQGSVSSHLRSGRDSRVASRSFLALFSDQFLPEIPGTLVLERDP